MALDPRQLRAFLAITECGSLGLAAEQAAGLVKALPVHDLAMPRRFSFSGGGATAYPAGGPIPRSAAQRTGVTIC